MTVPPIPNGYTSLTPFFVCEPATAAIDFYTEVFGAKVVARNNLPDGRVAHCELQFPSGRMQLGDPAPEYNLIKPTGDDDVSRSTVLYLDDVDTAYKAAVTAGAKGYGDPSTFVTGDRYAAILDPFGHRWAMMTRVEDVSEEEAKLRVDEWLATQN